MKVRESGMPEEGMWKEFFNVKNILKKMEYGINGEKKMKKIILIGLFVILFSFLVTAQEEHDFTNTKQLIDSGISCNNLTNEQLEIIGDYYMEQMHPGEAHEYMDRMMGGEGSESLKIVHINIARRIYCNENVGGMMGGGMMGNYYYQNPQNNNLSQNREGKQNER